MTEISKTIALKKLISKKMIFKFCKDNTTTSTRVTNLYTANSNFYIRQSVELVALKTYELHFYLRCRFSNLIRISQFLAAPCSDDIVGKVIFEFALINLESKIL